MQTHLVRKIIHQNLAVILWQLNYSKISFIVLVPEIRSSIPVIGKQSLFTMNYFDNMKIK